LVTQLLSIIKGGSPYLYKNVGINYETRGGNIYDDKVNEIAHKIMDLDKECTSSNCNIKMRELSKLRGELYTAWMHSSYCNSASNCNIELSKYIMSITPKLREFKDQSYSHHVDSDSESLSPKEAIAKLSSHGGLYNYYNQNGGSIKDKLLNQLRQEIDQIRYPDRYI
jgi:hypothetical protein